MLIDLGKIINSVLTAYLMVDGSRIFFWFSEMEETYPYIPDRLVEEWIEQTFADMAAEYHFGSWGEDGIIRNSEIIEELLKHPKAPPLEKLKENCTTFEFWDYNTHLEEVRGFLVFEIIKHAIANEIWRGANVARELVEWLHKNKDQYKISLRELECIHVSVRDAYDGFTLNLEENLTMYISEEKTPEGKEGLFAIVGTDLTTELVVHCDWARPK